MSNVSKLKKKAADFEQKRQFDRAVQAYIELLGTLANDIDDADIPLYNRVGDLLIRQNSASEALVYYEKAVDLYSERGFLNNAIALCNKILRQSPGRTVIYYKLGKISATKGFKSDAKRNFLEYADRMEKTGKRDEAFRALKEFADLCPDQDDVRLMLAEHLARENRREEAIEQLQTLHAKLETEGRSAEARATLDRMKAIDPEAEPKASGSYQSVKSNELIFLDVDDVPSPRQATKTPPESVPSSRAPQPEAAPHTDVASPQGALDGLSLTLVPDAVDASAVESELLDGFTPTGEHDRVTPGAVAPIEDFDTGRHEATDLDLDFPSLVDISTVPASDGDLEELELESFADETMSETEFAALELEPLDSPVEERPHDLALPTELPLLTFTDEVPAIAEDAAEAPELDAHAVDLDTQIMSPMTRNAPPSPTIEERAFDLAETDPASDNQPLTLEQAAALSLQPDDDEVPNEEPTAVDAVEPQSMGTADAEAATEDSEAPVSEGAHPLEWEDLAEAAAAHTVKAVELPPTEQPTVEPTKGEAETDIDPHFLDQVPNFGREETQGDETFSPVPLSPETLAPDDSFDHIAPISELEPEPEAATAEPSNAAAARHEAARTLEAHAVVRALRQQVEASPNDGKLRRRLAEALLHVGEREPGLRELDAAMQRLENEGDLDLAREIAHEILRLVPESVRHHQKCVEYAVRAGDRGQLIDAYIALGDALFRSGQHDKAQAVYSRVLEMAPNESRANHSLELLASGTPPATEIVEAAAAEEEPDDEGPEAGDPSFEELDFEDLDAEVAAAFQSGDDDGYDSDDDARPTEGFATPAFVPSNGEFVDLGAMLRGDQPTKSTRMVVGDAKPTGDEQADFEDMLKRFKQGVAANVDDEDFDSHYDLGVAFKEMGLVDDAIAQFQKALRSDTHRSRAYEALGQCFLEKNQHQVAATLLKRAVETTQVDDRVLVGSLYLLAYALEHLERDREALVYYHRVFAVDVEFRDVATRIRALESQAAT